jgi:hypothetical protein
MELITRKKKKKKSRLFFFLHNRYDVRMVHLLVFVDIQFLHTVTKEDCCFHNSNLLWVTHRLED